jgi:glycerol-3-phosphate dehydrogenase subunit C
MGQPALELLRLVPGLEVTPSRAECCGVGGTYGYTVGKADIARSVGRTLLQQIEEVRPEVIVCDSETCRWNIEQASGLRTVHPVEVLAAALGGDPSIAGSATR